MKKPQNEHKDTLVKHIMAIREGKENTFSFDSLEDAKGWLDD